MKKNKKTKKTKRTKKINNKIISLTAILLLGFLLFAFYKHSCRLPQMTIVLPNSQKISVEVASNDKERGKGLMFRKKLKRNEGMLFVFKDDSQKHFWMKNTLIDLDILFIGEDFIINEIFENVKKSEPNAKDFEIERVSAKGKYILELVAGSAEKHLLRAGLKIKIESVKEGLKDSD